MQGSDGPKKILFVGSNNTLNIKGIHWFLQGPWLTIRNAIPGITLHVCGSICDGIRVDDTQVILLGRVEDLSGEYRKATVVIVPMTEGTGLNIKLVEAASFGKAIIATPCVLNGGPMFRGSILVGEATQEFSGHAIAAILDINLRKHLEGAALSVVKEHLSPEACYAHLIEQT